MGRTKREDFVTDVATEIFIKKAVDECDEVVFADVATKSVHAASILYAVFEKEGLIK